MKELKLRELRKLTDQEALEAAKELYPNNEKMAKYLAEENDMYIFSDGKILQLEKSKKIEISKDLWFDDEMETPEKTVENFIEYNMNIKNPMRHLKEYLEEKRKMREYGAASGRYDYKGIYLTNFRSNTTRFVGYDFQNRDLNKWGYFERYLTEAEESDLIDILETQRKEYIERLEKYYKRYNKNIYWRGYWVNR